MKKITIILLVIITLLSFNSKTEIDEQTKQEMFCKGLNNLSTAPNYIVLNIKSLKTGEIKEICTEAPFLSGAIYKEYGKYPDKIDCKKNRERYFEFSKDSALWNINYNLYTKISLDSFAKTINIEEIIKLVKSGKLESKTFKNSRKEQIMFAHLMFNNGVMMTRGCVAGNICGLSFYTKSKK
jgi:hypothetical protein